jgi:hypothetical protein
MQRRRLLQLGLISGAALGLGGAYYVARAPALHHQKMSGAALDMCAALAQALLHEVLPKPADLRRAAVQRLLDRMQAVVWALPAPTQAELNQLLSILSNPAGRWLLMGLSSGWHVVSVEQVRQGLSKLQTSQFDLSKQAYLALHDWVGGAYFAAPEAWGKMNYPGPVSI